MKESIHNAIYGECHEELSQRQKREQKMKFMENDRNEHTRNIFSQKPYYMQHMQKKKDKEQG